MDKNISYDQAIERCKKEIRSPSPIFDAFTVSSVLAVAFDTSKEQTMSDLLDIKLGELFSG